MVDALSLGVKKANDNDLPSFLHVSLQINHALATVTTTTRNQTKA